MVWNFMMIDAQDFLRISDNLNVLRVKNHAWQNFCHLVKKFFFLEITLIIKRLKVFLVLKYNYKESWMNFYVTSRPMSVSL